MTVEDFFLEIVCRYMQKLSKGRLEYFSKSENASLGWYFWLTKIKGVYELELEEQSRTDKQAEFYVRYYPALEEEVLETYSVEEQLLRFNQDVFDDQPIDITIQDPADICPCCLSTGNHEDDSYVDFHNIHNTTFLPGSDIVVGHPRTNPFATSSSNGRPGPGKAGSRFKVYYGTFARAGKDQQSQEEVKRPKGIPQILPKFNFPKELFTIGKLAVELLPEAGETKLLPYRLTLTTQERLVTYAQEPILMLENGEEVELVPQGGINRNVPGAELGKTFMEFLCKDFLQVVADPDTPAKISYQTDLSAKEEGNNTEKVVPGMVYMYIKGKERCQNG